MASARPEDTLSVPVNVCTNPTDLSTDFPHGGTALGLLRPGDSHWQAGVGTFPIVSEEWGHATATISTGTVATLSMFLRQWDGDALSATHLNTETGATTGRTMAHLDVGENEKRPGSTHAGVVLYLSPRADQHPGLLLFHASSSAFQDPMSFATARPFEIPLVWYAQPADVDGDSRVWTQGLRDDLDTKFGAWLAAL